MKRRKIIKKRTNGRRSYGLKSSADQNITRDFSSVEDAPNSFKIIKDIVYRAGRNAAAEAKVAGLPHTFARKNVIIRRKQNGEEEIIGTAESANTNRASFYIHYKPSTILHARKK